MVSYSSLALIVFSFIPNADAGIVATPVRIVGIEVSDGSIDTSKLATDAVTNSKIITGAVDSRTLATGAVLSGSLGAGAVDTSKLATDSVTNAKIITSAVDTRALASDAVVAASIITGAIQTGKLASDAVTSAAIITGAVDTNKLSSDAVTSAKLITGAVGTSKLAADAVTGSKIISGAVDTPKLSSDVQASISNKVLKAGDFMTGQLTTESTITVKGNAFSVGGSTFIVSGGTSSFNGMVRFSTTTVFVPTAFSTNPVSTSGGGFFTNAADGKLSAWNIGYSSGPVLSTPAFYDCVFSSGPVPVALVAASLVTSSVTCAAPRIPFNIGCALTGTGGSTFVLAPYQQGTTQGICVADTSILVGAEFIQVTTSCCQ